VEELLAGLGAEFYVNPDAARDAMQREGMFD
jgi:hypothetical protein